MPSILIQVVEKPGAGLFRELQQAMRSGHLQTFSLERRGKKVVHTNSNYPGWMNWSHQHGVITGTVLSPNKPGSEWKLLSAFIGRLADRYSDKIVSVSIQFVTE
ncbi:MAG: hypothetical protein A3F84_02680 [Candidatus Handelsmanbacteria bacterium RIFCSPLOWO2_12_FULL_64_10]|uniref:Uncharacterized protein n=1 Tax=Handelsmanbacteria sp. (strain RIFCSPLOWO2_12_FULL_64_10) TaxID=1817868 RepID=A0A1F6CX19_HANXR|nr:MAG: hypothetical protein A3F84_02680 [Candidatus Handelsmanbacteria bacterium RIFCSPLOWO2_12_FULL_64_10]